MPPLPTFSALPLLASAVAPTVPMPSRPPPSSSLVEGFGPDAHGVALPPLSCALALVSHHCAVPKEAGARRYVQYAIRVQMEAHGDAAGGGGAAVEEAGADDDALIHRSWRVHRRYSQFEELHQNLWARHAAEIRRSGAQLPGKFRFPSTLDVEGEERAPHLHTYLQRLMNSPELRKSEQLVYFLAANKPARRRLWNAAL